MADSLGLEDRIAKASRRLDSMHRFSARLVRTRKEAGVSPDQLAERSGLNRSTVGRLEAGQVDARLSVIEDLATGLGISPTALMADRAHGGM